MAKPAEPEYDYLCKLLLIGDSGVGKSNILIRFADDDFKEDHLATLGVDFKICTRDIEGKIVKMALWDTAGQERFRVITSSYYRGSHGIMVVYDVTDRQSFNHVRMWMQEIEKYAAYGEVTRIIVGNKCDLVSAKRAVAPEEGQELANELGVRFIETSARNSHNIEHTFDLVCRELMATHAPRRAPAPAAALASLTLRPSLPSVRGGAGGCCK